MIFTACGSKSASTKKTETKVSSVIQTTKASDPSKNPTAAQNRKDTLIIGNGVPGGNFVSYYAETLTDAYISDTITDGLTDVDENGNPAPGVAKSWDISKDGLTYTFHMRNDVKNSDGTPVTADDVKFTLEVINDPSFSGGVDPSAIGIKGWKDFKDGKTNDLEGVKVIDKNTVSVTLEKPNSSFLYLVGTVILPKGYYGKDYTPGNTKSIEAKLQNPVGCGPYKITKYIPGQEADLTANESYWKGAPKIKNLIFKATTNQNKMQNLISGATDVDTFDATPENISQLKQAGFLDLTTYPSSSIFYLGLNLKDPKFSDKNVRQALAYGLNRQQLINTIYKGNAFLCSEPQSKAHPSYVNDVNEYKYNVEKANQLLDAAGWKKGSDGIRQKDGVKFVMHVRANSTNAAYQLVIPIMKENYKELGIDVVPEYIDLNTLLSKLKTRDFEAYLMGTSIGADAISSNLSANFRTGATNNYNGYSNTEVDNLIDQAVKETDASKRTAIEQKVYKIINEDLPFIFTYQPETVWASNSRVTGIKFLPYQYYSYSVYKAEIK
jgi:peptide/nickel transport system substrate-binding protein